MNVTSSVNCSISKHSRERLRIILFRNISTIVWALNLTGGISQSFAYDNIGRLVDSKTRQSSKMRRERKYHWGKAGRPIKTEDSLYGTTTYEYSATGHLQKATYADGREEYRLSDKVGNLFDDPERKLRKYLQGGKIE